MKRLLLFLILTTCMFQDGLAGNYWIKISDFGGFKRSKAVAFTVGDYAYVGTGVDTSETVFNDFWKYDPIADSWTQVANISGPRRNAIAFSIGSFGYVGSGHPTDVFAGSASNYNDFWRYDPTANNWSPRATCPLQVYLATGFAVGNRGYICGGKIGSNFYTNALWEYNPTTDSWAPRTGFPGGVRVRLSSFVINNSAYVGLGNDQDMYRDDIWEYKPSNNQWVQRADLPGSERGSAATFSIDQRGYVCMGTNGGIQDDLWEYNPYEDDWTVRDNYSGSSRYWAVGFSLLGEGYVGIGTGYSGKKKSFYKYIPADGLGIDELPTAFGVYPNPVKSTVHLSHVDQRIHDFQIVSLDGKLLLTADSDESIDVSNFNSGHYILAGHDEAGNLIGRQKIIVQ